VLLINAVTRPRAAEAIGMYLPVGQGFAPVAPPEAMAVTKTLTVPCIILAAVCSMSFMSNAFARG
jgi:hypothetical protein